MLIDEANISIKAGNGGNGTVHFYIDKFRPKGGPDGGDGGHGGSIFFEAVEDISKLSQFRFAKVFEAENGQQGGRNQMTGKNGEDLIIKIPVGSVVTYDNGTSVEFTTAGQVIKMAAGGKGGWGNHHFRSSINQAPKESNPGQKTVVKHINIQLKLIAHIGLIGLPNAGKSSLLNELTSAKAKVANYNFTTLEPNLGSLKGGKIIADIPGLIEGASSGKGLGYKFLKHIERTQILLHCLSGESQNPEKDYQVIRQELTNYSSILAQKQEILIITKSDLITDKSKFKDLNPKLFVSIIDDQSIKELFTLIQSSFS